MLLDSAPLGEGGEEEEKATATEKTEKDAVSEKEDDGVVVDPAVLEATFVFCLVWSLGASVIQKHGFNDRDRVDAFIKKLAGFSCKEGEGLSPTTLPKASLYEYRFDVEKKKWFTWRSSVTPLEIEPGARFASILVPTVDTVRSTWLGLLRREGQARSVRRRQRTAKTVTIAKYLANLDIGKNVLLGMNFSSRTTSMDVQRGVEEVVEKRAKDTYGPAAGKRLVLFFDDLNMPKVDLYARSSPSRCSRPSSSARVCTTAEGTQLEEDARLQLRRGDGPAGRRRGNPWTRGSSRCSTRWRSSSPIRRTCAPSTPPFVVARRDPQPARAGGGGRAHRCDARSVRPHPGEAAANAVALPLHLQPARPIAHLRGFAVRAQGAVRDGRELHPAVAQRGAAHPARPPHLRGGQDGCHREARRARDGEIRARRPCGARGPHPVRRLQARLERGGFDGRRHGEAPGGPPVRGPRLVRGRQASVRGDPRLVQRGEQADEPGVLRGRARAPHAHTGSCVSTWATRFSSAWAARASSRSPSWRRSPPGAASSRSRSRAATTKPLSGGPQDALHARRREEREGDVPLHGHARRG